MNMQEVAKQIKQDLEESIDHQLTPSDINKVLEYFLFISVKDLKKLSITPSTPIGIKSLANGLLKDISEGKITTLNKIMNRVYGKPPLKAT